MNRYTKHKVWHESLKSVILLIVYNYYVDHANYREYFCKRGQMEAISRKKVNISRTAFSVFSISSRTIYKYFLRVKYAIIDKISSSLQDQGFLLQFISNSLDRAVIFNIKIVIPFFPLVGTFRDYMTFCMKSGFIRPNWHTLEWQFSKTNDIAEYIILCNENLG